jgi:hypothetical protein
MGTSEPKPESGVAKAGKTWVRPGLNDASGGDLMTDGGSAQDLSSTPCVFFQQGTCKRGDACKFAHVAAADGDGNVDMGEA